MQIGLGFSQKLGIRGMIAYENIKCGDIIEISPLIILDKRDTEIAENTVMKKYLFEWEDGTAAVCLGFGSLYNHSSDNNVETIKQGSKIIFKANRDIEAGEELFISYGDDEESVAKRYEFDRKI